MSDVEKRHMPASAISGFLEITEHVVLGGMSMSDQMRKVVDEIEEHEHQVAAEQEDHRQEDPEKQPRIDTAYYNLGKIAAINAFLDVPPRNKLGF
jgi:hypothetical protein